MQIPGRTYSSGNGYRFGYNGQEKDNEIAGNGNHYNFKSRIYNPLTCRFYSVDPLSDKYPWNSSYSFAANMVIQFIELEGAEVARPASMTGADYHPAIDAVGQETPNIEIIQTREAAMNKPTPPPPPQPVIKTPDAPGANAQLITQMKQEAILTGNTEMQNYLGINTTLTMRDAGKDLSTGGKVTVGVGAVAAGIGLVVGVPEPGVFIMEAGAAMTLPSTALTVGGDFQNGDYKAAAIDVASYGIGQATGGLIKARVPDEVHQVFIKSAADVFIDKSAEALKEPEPIQETDECK
jgi:RHS repeat-associated protein